MEMFYFIDESGDADFFGKRGKELWRLKDWNAYLILGMMVTNNRIKLRENVMSFHRKLKSDKLYKGIVSFDNENHFFHAKNDHPEIRAEFYRFLRSEPDFNCYFSLIEKDPVVFSTEFSRDSKQFYFHIVEHLLKLPSYLSDDEHNFYLSRRTKHTHADFDRVIQNAIESKMKGQNLPYKANVVKSQEYPELSIIDYVLWALQRCLIKKESRFLDVLSNKISGITLVNGDVKNLTDMNFSTEEFINKFK